MPERRIISPRGRPDDAGSPGQRNASKRPRGLVQRAHIASQLAGFDTPGDTVSERNYARRQYIENYLRTETNTGDTDIALILSDLPSYNEWEGGAKFRQH